MDSRSLKRFLAVYELGSIGAAAEALHLSQPALSKSIHQLEEQLGTRLFERTPVGVIPTIFGETLSLHAKVIEAEIRNAVREIQTLTGATKGEMSVGVTPSIAAHIMPRVALKMHEERPGIHIKVIEGLMEDNIPALRLGELDMVVGGWTQGMHADLVTESIMKDQAQVFASANHPLAGKKVTLEALCDYPWVMAPYTQFWLDTFEKAFVARGLNPPLADIIANSALFICELLLGDKFLTFLPRQLLTRGIGQGQFVALAPERVVAPISIMVCYRERAVHPSAFNVVLSTLKDVCAMKS